MDVSTAVTIGSALALFLALFGFWWKLDGKIERVDTKLDGKIGSLDIELGNKIEGVRQTSASAHENIISELGEIRVEQATHTERLKCIEGKVDDIKRGNSPD